MQAFAALRPKPQRQAISHLQPLLGIAYAIGLCGFVGALAYGLSQELDYHAMVAALRRLPLSALALSIAATILSFLTLVGRELCALRYVGARLPAPVAAIESFCGNA